MRRLMLLVIMLYCAGCAASVPLAPASLDQVAKHFQPPVGETLVYVVRRLGEGMMTIFQVFVDGKILGSVAPGTYLVLPVAPGPHSITSFTAENQAEMTVLAQEGHLYFVHMFPRMGWNATRVGLETLNEAAGREAVQAASMAQGLARP